MAVSGRTLDLCRIQDLSNVPGWQGVYPNFDRVRSMEVENSLCIECWVTLAIDS